MPEINTGALEDPASKALQSALANVRLSPQSASAWGTLGLILHAHDFTDEAVGAYRHAAELDPTDAQWPYLLGLLLLPRAAALEPLRTAARIAPHEPVTRLRLGQALADHGQRDAAATEFHTLLEQHPNYQPARVEQAKLYVTQADYQKAVDCLKPALNEASPDRQAYAVLALALGRMNKTGPAEAALRVMDNLSENTRWPDPYLAKLAVHQVSERHLVSQGKRYLDAGMAARAQEIAMRAVQAYPNSAEAWMLQGRVHLQKTNCTEAQSAFRRHLALDVNSVNGYSQLGVALLCLERYGEAVTALRTAVRLKPDFGHAHFNLGYALARQGDTTEAMHAFREAIRCSPDIIDPYIVLADLLGQSGERAEARSIIEQAQALNPNDPRAASIARRLAQR